MILAPETTSEPSPEITIVDDSRDSTRYSRCLSSSKHTLAQEATITRTKNQLTPIRAYERGVQEYIVP